VSRARENLLVDVRGQFGDALPYGLGIAPVMPSSRAISTTVIAAPRRLEWSV
jgi:hypothetical protein